jgi:glycosyltransferase involved in cell wall biosynthesis
MANVSVILPTCNRYSVLLRNIENIRLQDHPVEICVSDDSHINDYKKNRKLVEEIREKADKYIYTATYDHEGKKLYGLGRARNFGLIESTGEFVIFLDDRITPAIPKMISKFVVRLMEAKRKKLWLFGNKGANKTSFVENCSAARKSEIIAAGMFPETINRYGFMTREVYSRFLRQGFKFIYLPDALAKPLCSGTRRNDPKRKADITYSKNVLRKMKLI